MRRSRPNSRRSNAFTLIELLAVIAIIAILAALILAVLSKAQEKGRAAFCLNNVKQLSYAWLLYADDNADNVVINGSSAPDNFAGWCAGWLDWDSGSPFGANTNNQILTGSALGPYTKNVSIYKCPSDRVDSQIGPRNRSVSMNGYVGDYDHTRWDPGFGQSAYREFLKTTELIQPGAANTWLFMDEHPDSINDAFFGEYMSQNVWNDVPASYHNGGCCISFADGHGEMHHWLDANTKAPICKAGSCLATGQVSLNDLPWLQARTTVLQ